MNTWGTQTALDLWYDIKMQLTDNQAEAVANIIEAYSDGAVAATLSGPPGAGKTYTTGAIVRLMWEAGHTIAFVGSTNRSLQVARNAAIKAGWYHLVSWWGTAHRLLGLVLKDGEIRKLGRVHKGFTFAVIDEASMLEADVLHRLMQVVPLSLYVGDRNQLPPIGENFPTAFVIGGESLAGSRRSGNQQLLELIAAVQKAVENGTATIPDDLLSPFLVTREAFEAELSTAQDHIALAYTNEETRRMSRLARKHAGYTDEYVEGDRLIFLEPHYRDLMGIRGDLVFPASQIVTVHEAHRDWSADFPVWRLTVGHDGITDTIRMPDTTGEAPLFWEQLLADRQKPPKVARAAYAYGITTHRAQGGEWNTVSVNLDDIARCSEERLRIKLVYVAFSRARENLRVFSSNPSIWIV